MDDTTTPRHNDVNRSDVNGTTPILKLVNAAGATSRNTNVKQMLEYALKHCEEETPASAFLILNFGGTDIRHIGANCTIGDILLYLEISKSQVLVEACNAANRPPPKSG